MPSERLSQRKRWARARKAQERWKAQQAFVLREGPGVYGDGEDLRRARQGAYYTEAGIKLGRHRPPIVEDIIAEFKHLGRLEFPLPAPKERDNQWPTNRCVGSMFYHGRESSDLDAKPGVPSPPTIWKEAKRRDGLELPDSNRGTTLRAAADWLMEHGYIDDTPGQCELISGRDWRKILDALAAGFRVGQGTVFPKSMGVPGLCKDEPIVKFGGVPVGQDIGLHATDICGVNLIPGHISYHNSWGDPWVLHLPAVDWVYCVSGICPQFENEVVDKWSKVPLEHRPADAIMYKPKFK